MVTGGDEAGRLFELRSEPARDLARQAGLEEARELGLLTVALTGGAVQSRGGPIATSKAVDHVLVAASADPRVVKEMHVTAYHILWELVHVFFEQPGVLGPGVIT